MKTIYLETEKITERMCDCERNTQIEEMKLFHFRVSRLTFYAVELVSMNSYLSGRLNTSAAVNVKRGRICRANQTIDQILHVFLSGR